MSDDFKQLHFSFNMDEAKAYMQTMFHLEGQRDELNDAINEARQNARQRGVPTKAVEAAIRAAKGRRKSNLAPSEFQAIMDAADDMLPDE